MSRGSTMAASVLLVVFGGLAMVAQLLDFNQKQLGPESIIGTYYEGQKLGRASGIVQRGGGDFRQLDLILPDDARVFMAGMTGTANTERLGYYYYLTYYLFPREVAVTLDRPRFTLAGFQGHGTESDAEMETNGFGVRVDVSPAGKMQVIGFKGATLKEAIKPDWFDSWSDTSRAFLLPLLTALSGVWLLRFLFGHELTGRMAMAERLACGLGLGMMAVAALTLGVKLCGFHGYGWMLVLTAAGGFAEVRRSRKVLGDSITGGFRSVLTQPVRAVIFAAGAAVFLILFRLAALQGIHEFDAAADWMFKAKIFFLCTGREIAGWFANPRLAYANMDYPTLVPSLHAATYDSLGHVDEFVTKFWPTWMLLLLLLALASLNRGGTSRFQAPLFFLLGVLLLPITLAFVQLEGATLPMVFFTTLGFVQCVGGLEEKSGVRLGLGLTLLFGAAMAKFEGAVFLALAAGWLLLLPKTRSLLKPSRQCWRTLVFCFLAALPFLWLRSQIQVVHFDSGWAGYALAQPDITFSNAPKIFFMILARRFVDPAFAKWSAADGHIHWCGEWNGWSSLYNHGTLGLPWFCLLLTCLLWVAAPARRRTIFWTLMVLVSALVTFSVVFASYISIRGLDQVITEWTPDDAAGRYLFPLLLAWAAVMIMLFFGNFPPPAAADEEQPVLRDPSDGVNPGIDKCANRNYLNG